MSLRIAGSICRPLESTIRASVAVLPSELPPGTERPSYMLVGEHRAAYLPPIGSETTQVSQGRENLDPDNGPMVTGRIDTIDHQGERAGTVLN